MSECDLDTPVPDWVIEHPDTLAVFKELGIDYFCGGKSLGFACRQRGLDPEFCYAFMQAVGMVNDHVVECFRHSELSRAAKKPK
jgi:regulator of cell morphogenesis and NO signaling